MDHRSAYDALGAGGALLRVHGHQIGPAVDVAQQETNRAGVISYGEARIILSAQDDIGAAHARRIASDLETAAELLEHLTAGAR